MSRDSRLDDAVMTSNSAQVAALCATLADRKHLCSTCESVSSKISKYLIACHDPSQRSPYRDDYWPPRNFDSPYPGEAISDGFRFLPPEEVKPREGKELPPNVLRHHTKAGELLVTAKSCALCEIIRIAIIMDCLRKKTYPIDVPKEPFSSIVAAIHSGKGSRTFQKIIEELKSSEEPIYLMLWDGIGFSGMTLEQLRKFGGFKNRLHHIKVIWQRPKELIREEDRKVVWTKLNVFTSRGTTKEMETYVMTRRPLRNSGSFEAFELMRYWLHTCKERHDSCVRDIERKEMDADELHTLPTRVLDVGPPGSEANPFLIETIDYPKSHWVALSHCWGKPSHHPLKTTRNTIAKHMNGIQFSELPKTFVEAIIVTRALGFRYLWIDSLCIVQDDEEDWLKESKTMGLIYQNAYLTLAASSAPDSMHGLFIQRDYSSLQIPLVDLPLQQNDPTKGSQSTLGHFSIGIEWRQEPFVRPPDPYLSRLAFRGWATQEWILSRRIIHFVDEGIVWACHCHAEDEAGQMIIGRKLAEAEWCTEWGRVIIEHSAREFSYNKDRLLSLEGLATEIAKTKKHMMSRLFGMLQEYDGKCIKDPRYWEGVFAIDIPEHILWTPTEPAEKLDGFASWSWASHPGQVYLRFREFDPHTPYYEYVSNCKVLGCDEVTKALGLKAKRIRFEHLLTKKVKREYGPVTRGCYHGPYYDGYSIASLDEDPCGWACFDDGRGVDGTEPLYFLDLAKVTTYGDPRPEYYGFILVKVQRTDERSAGNGSMCVRNEEREERHVRVGVAARRDTAWTEAAKEGETWVI